MVDRDRLAAGWTVFERQNGQVMVACGDHGVLPIAEAYVLFDALTTTSRNREPLR